MKITNTKFICHLCSVKHDDIASTVAIGKFRCHGTTAGATSNHKNSAPVDNNIDSYS
jgi:hypothetical protein